MSQINNWESIKILFLSKNMASYRAAMYQQDVADTIQQICSVEFYGPGYDGFDESICLRDKFGDRLDSFDFIFIGHSWLCDVDGLNVDSFPKLGIEKVSIAKVAFLNKEYVNLENKLNWMHKSNIDLVVTHSHKVDKLFKLKRLNFFFMPFGFNQAKLYTEWVIKDIDLSFSGILQNQNIASGQSDCRLRIMKELFFCWFDIPFAKRQPYSNLNICWNTIPRSRSRRMLAKTLGKYKFLSDNDYYSVLGRSKVFLNSLSPFELVSPRYFECMASRALILSEESDVLSQVLPSGCFVTFKPDLSDFRRKLEMCINDSDLRTEIVDKAYSLSVGSCSWSARVSNLMREITSKNNGLI